jgi:hypothetical protein
MNTPAPHRKHHLCCAAAHFALAVIALLERSLAVAAAEATVAAVYADLARREHS